METPTTDSMTNSADRFGDRDVVPAKWARQLEGALRIIAAETEYPCEIMDLNGNDGPCQCTCCRWARLAKDALVV